MRMTPRLTAPTLAFLVLMSPANRSEGQAAVPLPAGVKAVWALDGAWEESTPTRQRVCINGLWRWQPAGGKSDAVPDGNWGYFKVPGCWPGVTDYLQKDSQTVFGHPAWKDANLRDVTSAWYQREVTIPRQWEGRRVALSIEYLNSLAVVFVDGKKAGEGRFPAGEVDLSSVCRPGQTHVLSVLVVALPLKGVMLAYTDSAHAREVKGTVPRRGLCGDVFLVSTPASARLDDVKVETSMRQGTVTVRAGARGLAPDGRYELRARITDNGRTLREFTGGPFGAADLVDGRFSFTTRWNTDRHWDLDTPQNTFELQVNLEDATGTVLDTGRPRRFGFRELWIDGRDFIFNGTRLFLSAVPLDNAQIGAASATYAAAKETLARLKRIGINCVYTHNYDCNPGSHLSFEEILRAADDVGMLVALTQPHFAQYDWTASGADAANGYADHARWYARVAGNHPSVVFYSTSHNATGYDEDMNPDRIGVGDVERDKWSAKNAALALRAEAIVRRFDPSRIVYHHAGGNIGSMDTINFYPNFAPIQELSDWFGHWARAGTKPLFLCEYGAPFTWDWTMYRGFYQGKREWGSAAVPWEFCLAEWDAQFHGDRAFDPSDREKANLRWEAKQFRDGNVWHRWDYPTSVGDASFGRRNEILASYLTDNWRAFRTWGVSGISPWEYEVYWTPRPGVDRARKSLPVDWDHLQRPGFSPDYIDHPFERIDTAYEWDDWVPTAAGKALLRNNQPVLAYIAGPGGAFTAKDHVFRAGETVEKQLVLVNNSRRTITGKCEWSLPLNPPLSGDADLYVPTGRQGAMKIKLKLPGDLEPGEYALHARARLPDGSEQEDTFPLHVVAAAAPVQSEVTLFDPAGETAALLRDLGVHFRSIAADDEPPAGGILVVGKNALTLDGAAPSLLAVRDGLKVVVFEQPSQVLEKRLGFRVTEYGIRQVFPRIPDHPALSGIGVEHLRDWRGESTLLPPRLPYELHPQHGPTVQWCGIAVSRVWRCGNRGDVASVLIEKPARGDFRPILDCGFSLQYSPLVECRQGKGLVLFCQLDVTGRTESEPAAKAIVANLLNYAATWKPQAPRCARYAGEPAGMTYLKSAGVQAALYDGGELSPDADALVVGPGGGRMLAAHREDVARFVRAGGRLLGLALDAQDVEALLPFQVGIKTAEHVGAIFDPPSWTSPLAGIGAADVYVRAPRERPLVSSGATIVGDGVLALAPADAARPNVVLCQLAPWQFGFDKNYGLKRTFRRSSVLVSRLLANLGVSGATPLLDHWDKPLRDANSEKRWLDGLYLDAPEEWDDPYRFFRW